MGGVPSEVEETNMPAAATEAIFCTVCGSSNKEDAERCASCGARLERLSLSEMSPEEKAAARYQQQTFSWKWVAVSLAIYLVLQGVLIGLLPMVIPNYDPQGIAGMAITWGTWFLGGLTVGLVSPGKTFFEPVVAAVIAAFPTVAVLMKLSDVDQITMLSGVFGGMIGVMITLMGAFLGELVQMRREGL